jgi:hypothetical protein
LGSGSRKGASHRELAQLQDEISRLRAESERGKASVDEADRLKAENQRLLKDVERVEGEYQSLRLLHEEHKRKLQQWSGGPGDKLESLALSSEAEEAFRTLAAEKQRLAEEVARLEAETIRVKTEATRKIKELKGDLDKRAAESETMRFQKDNLMKQLMARDSGQAAPREITLEEITNSEVFKNMLGNIRRTSRVEVTHLHDAIAQIKDVDPKAYMLCLDFVARQFKKAAMENPLATLPRL